MRLAFTSMQRYILKRLILPFFSINLPCALLLPFFRNSLCQNYHIKYDEIQYFNYVFFYVSVAMQNTVATGAHTHTHTATTTINFIVRSSIHFRSFCFFGRSCSVLRFMITVRAHSDTLNEYTSWRRPYRDVRSVFYGCEKTIQQFTGTQSTIHRTKWNV